MKQLVTAIIIFLACCIASCSNNSMKETVEEQIPEEQVREFHFPKLPRGIQEAHDSVISGLLYSIDYTLDGDAQAYPIYVEMSGRAFTMVLNEDSTYNRHYLSVRADTLICNRFHFEYTDPLKADTVKIFAGFGSGRVLYEVKDTTGWGSFACLPGYNIFLDPDTNFFVHSEYY